jgi:uncharacterized membrane protein (UPF0127 family)
MKNKKKIFSFIIVLVFLLAGFFSISKYKSNPSLSLPLSREGLGEVSSPDKGNIGGYPNIKYVEIGGQKIKVDLALTEVEQEQGLSGRKSLNENEGMLFVFPQSGKYLFWMKDMNFPIDIIWLTSDMKVDYIKNNASPELYPETYGPGISDGNAKYVLEVSSGFANKNNLKVGDSIQFVY